VIFITKTDGIDVWDLMDQSNKPSITMNFATSVITYMRFQHYKHADGRQYMAFGDEKDGTLFLWEVPHNLKNPSSKDEKENVEKFWDKEVEKCLFVADQREQKKEDWSTAKQEIEKQKALREAEKDISEEARQQKIDDNENAYQDLLLVYKHKFGMLTYEELANIQAEKKKKK